MKEGFSFSWEKVVKTCDNNEKLAKNMIERFDQLFFDDALKQLQTSITKSDNNETTTQLHSLWANFLYIGAFNGEAIVKEMETALSQNNKEKLIGSYLELLDESKEIKKHVSKVLNNSPQVNEIEQYEKSIKKDLPSAKQTTHRSNVPSMIDMKNKAAHAKLVQDKIRLKELQLDPNRLQSAYIELKSPEFAVPKSRILDQMNDIAQVTASVHNQASHRVNSALPEVNAGLGEIKTTANNKIEQAVVQKKQENIIDLTKGPGIVDVRSNMQRLIQAVISLSYDKVQLELRQLQETIKSSSQIDVEGQISRLRDSAQKQVENQIVDNSVALINEIKRLKPRFAEAHIETPSVEELNKYEREIKQKFSQNNKFGIEVALEGKNNGKKTTCCCTF